MFDLLYFNIAPKHILSQVSYCMYVYMYINIYVDTISMIGFAFSFMSSNVTCSFVLLFHGVAPLTKYVDLI